jgi:hypothetical protein
MPKGYWKTSRQFFKGIGKPLGNAQIPIVSKIGEEAELPSGYWQKCGNFHPFSLKRCVSFNVF